MDPWPVADKDHAFNLSPEEAALRTRGTTTPASKRVVVCVVSVFRSMLHAMPSLLCRDFWSVIF